MRMLFLALLLLASPAAAKDITVTMPEEAWAVNIQMLDAAVRAQGLSAAENAIFIRKAIEAAAKAAADAKDQPKPEDKK